MVGWAFEQYIIGFIWFFELTVYYEIPKHGRPSQIMIMTQIDIL
jgi:hypothetical protein